jgi:hypothetical protein
MNAPRSFFKFVPYARKDILENGLIKLSRIGEFNDPFELEPTITSTNPNENFIGEPPPIELVNKYKGKIEKYGIISLSTNNEINHLLAASIPDKRDPRANILMWSHYAESHKGFAIEFKHNFIDNIDIEPINYDSPRKYLTTEDIENESFNQIFHVKSNEWRYEQEYRGILPLSEATLIKEDDHHLFAIKKSSIASITLGCAMPKEHKQELMRIIRSDPHLTRPKSFMHD